METYEELIKKHRDEWKAIKAAEARALGYFEATGDASQMHECNQRRTEFLRKITITSPSDGQLGKTGQAHNKSGKKSRNSHYQKTMNPTPTITIENLTIALPEAMAQALAEVLTQAAGAGAGHAPGGPAVSPSSTEEYPAEVSGASASLGQASGANLPQTPTSCQAGSPYPPTYRRPHPADPGFRVSPSLQAEFLLSTVHQELVKRAWSEECDCGTCALLRQIHPARNS